MRVDLVFPVLPPTLDGIGDYSAYLAQALSRSGCDVRILTAQEETTVDDDVTVETAFRLPPRRGVRSLLNSIRSAPPDWLLIQYNQFSYGQWGLNPFLPITVRAIRRQSPSTKVAVMFHEDFVPITNWKNAVMTTWQRAQFWALGREADVVGFSIQPWTKKYRSWFPQAEVAHWPVGSNIPFEDVSHASARHHLGLSDSTFVAGIFGSLHASRMIDWIRQAAGALQNRTDDFLLLYVGPNGSVLQQSIRDVRIHDAGPLPAAEVSLHLSAMDIHLAPFIDGASTRRGSFLAGLQHGVPTISTQGPLTDEMLAERNGNAFQLVPTSSNPEAFERATVGLCLDADCRDKMGSLAQRFFEEQFRWDTIAGRILDTLNTHHPTRSSA